MILETMNNTEEERLQEITKLFRAEMLERLLDNIHKTGWNKR